MKILTFLLLLAATTLAATLSTGTAAAHSYHEKQVFGHYYHVAPRRHNPRRTVHRHHRQHGAWMRCYTNHGSRYHYTYGEPHHRYPHYHGHDNQRRHHDHY